MVYWYCSGFVIAFENHVSFKAPNFKIVVCAQHVFTQLALILPSLIRESGLRIAEFFSMRKKWNSSKRSPSAVSTSEWLFLWFMFFCQGIQLLILFAVLLFRNKEEDCCCHHRIQDVAILRPCWQFGKSEFSLLGNANLLIVNGCNEPFKNKRLRALFYQG